MTPMNQVSRALGALTVAAAVLLGASPRAEAEVIERIVAVVNDDAIFLSELRRRSAPFLEQALSQPSAAARMAAIEQLYGEVLDRMVQEELFIQAAGDMQVTVTRAEVDRAIGNVRQQSGLSETDFWQAVRAQGFAPEQYRADVRRQLLRLKVLNHRARGRVNITEDQVRQRYDMLVARSNRTAQFTAAHVFVEVASGASATEVADARRRASAARDAMEDADDFWDAGGVSLGTLSEGSLPRPLEDALMRLEEGEISGVVRGPSGFHIFLLESRQQASSSVPPYDQVRMQIYQQMMGTAMEQQERVFVAELRRAALIDLRL